MLIIKHNRFMYLRVIYFMSLSLMIFEDIKSKSKGKKAQIKSYTEKIILVQLLFI